MTSVGIVQTLIPHYRQPVFAELASRPGIDLTVYATLNSTHGSLSGTGAVDEYATVDIRERQLGPFIWDPGSIRAARARHDVLILSWRARSLLLPARSDLHGDSAPRSSSGGMDSARTIHRVASACDSSRHSWPMPVCSTIR